MTSKGTAEAVPYDPTKGAMEAVLSSPMKGAKGGKISNNSVYSGNKVVVKKHLLPLTVHSILDCALCWKAFLENTTCHQQQWHDSIQKSLAKQPLVCD